MLRRLCRNTREINFRGADERRDLRRMPAFGNGGCDLNSFDHFHDATGQMPLDKQQPARLPHIDGWRGLAIICVLIGHFVPGATPMGGYGVELFFVLSGRLMADILFVKKTRLPRFFVRRFSRIYPGLFVFVAAIAALTLAARVADSDRGISLIEAVGALTFTMNYATALNWAPEGVLVHTWSLAVEEHCYILLAIIGLLFARNIAVVKFVCFSLGALAMANGVRLFLGDAGGIHDVYWRTGVRLAPIFLSAGFYLIIRRSNMGISYHPIFCAIISLPLYLFLEPLPLKFIVPTILLSYAVNSIDFSPAYLRSFLSHPALVLAGAISYSLYLWQQPFYIAFDGAIWALIPSVAIAFLSYRFIENPMRGWLNRKFIGLGRPSRVAA